VFLQVLDLSNNYLDHLPAGLFRDMGNLTRLTLHNNSLTSLDKDLFQVRGGRMRRMRRTIINVD